MLRAPDTPRRRWIRRAVFAAVALLAFVASLTTAPRRDAAASASDEAAFVSALNSVRAGVGLPPLTVNAQLADLARGHAQVMADAGEIFHANPISAGYTGPWTKMGENVGVGANVSVLVDAFVASPGHYANIVDPAFTQIGVGVVWSGSALYTTHRFLQTPGDQPATTTTAPPSTTAPPPTPPPSTTAPPPTPPPSTTAPPPSSTARPVAPPTTATTTTTTTLPPLPTPAITPERVLALIELLARVGT